MLYPSGSVSKRFWLKIS